MLWKQNLNLGKFSLKLNQDPCRMLGNAATNLLLGLPLVSISIVSHNQNPN